MRLQQFYFVTGVLLFMSGCDDLLSSPAKTPAVPSEAEQAAAKRAEAIFEKLKITDLVVGEGAEAKNGMLLKAHYIGKLDDGTTFCNSYEQNDPLEFRLGVFQVIPGWDRGLLGMKAGGKRQLIIPPELAYGDRGFPKLVPPNATLNYEIELLSISP